MFIQLTVTGCIFYALIIYNPIFFWINLFLPLMQMCVICLIIWDIPNKISYTFYECEEVNKKDENYENDIEIIIDQNTNPHQKQKSNPSTYPNTYDRSMPSLDEIEMTEYEIVDYEPYNADDLL